MGFEFYIFLFISGVIVGVSSGLLGIGGALLMFPILLYMPAIIGLEEIPVHLVTGIVAMQTTFGTAASSFFHKKAGNINFSLVFKVAAGMIVGAFIGAIASKYMSALIITWIYAIFLTIALFILLFKKGVDSKNSEAVDIEISSLQAIGLGLLVGGPAGAVGLGGSVVMIPALNTLFAVPIKICIGSAAMISFIGSLVTFISKTAIGQVELVSAIIVSFAATMGAFVGTNLNKRANSQLLRVVLIVLIILALIRVYLNIFLAY